MESRHAAVLLILEVFFSLTMTPSMSLKSKVLYRELLLLPIVD